MRSSTQSTTLAPASAALSRGVCFGVPGLGGAGRICGGSGGAGSLSLGMTYSGASSLRMVGRDG